MISEFILTITKWNFLFLQIDYKFIFALLIQIIVYNISIQKNILNIFFNGIIFLCIFAIYLFVYNAGAFVGFLFLCEITSIFVLYIILNKTNNMLFVFNKQQYINWSFIVFNCINIYTMHLFYTKHLLLQDNFYKHYILNNNDFYTITTYIYANYYNNLLLIIYTLIVLTTYIIHVVKNEKNNNKFFMQKSLNNNLYELFNNLNYYNKIFLNYFKKLCLIRLLAPKLTIC